MTGPGWDMTRRFLDTRDRKDTRQFLDTRNRTCPEYRTETGQVLDRTEAEQVLDWTETGQFLDRTETGQVLDTRVRTGPGYERQDRSCMNRTEK